MCNGKVLWILKFLHGTIHPAKEPFKSVLTSFMKIMGIMLLKHTAPSKTARNLGDVIDDQLTFSDHIVKTTQSCRFASNQITFIVTSPQHKCLGE